MQQDNEFWPTGADVQHTVDGKIARIIFTRDDGSSLAVVFPSPFLSPLVQTMQRAIGLGSGVPITPLQMKREATMKTIGQARAEVRGDEFAEVGALAGGYRRHAVAVLERRCQHRRQPAGSARCGSERGRRLRPPVHRERP